MRIEPKTIELKGGASALLRTAEPNDAAAIVRYMRTVCAQTDFLLSSSEEWDDSREEREAEFLETTLQSPNSAMLVCVVDNEIVGTCQVMLNRTSPKTYHRARVALALLRAYWRRGIGTVMLTRLIDIARENGATQVELGYLSGNERAKGLYEKLGFVPTGKLVNAVRLADGTMLDEIMMVKLL